MIELSALAKDICGEITSRTAVFATYIGVQGTKYPMAYVTARDKDMELCDGGRQIMRQVECVVEVYCSREGRQDRQSALLTNISSAIIPYFFACGRRFIPQGLSMGVEGGKGELRFIIGFCDLPPQSVVHENRDMMGEVLLDLGE